MLHVALGGESRVFVFQVRKLRCGGAMWLMNDVTCKLRLGQGYRHDH